MEATTTFEGKYTESVGRRKRAIARVRLYPGKGEMVINNRPADDFLPTQKLVDLVKKPLKEIGREESYNISVRVQGGGVRGQADAIILGVARCLVKEDETNKTVLKKAGFLKRDDRRKERKKPGLKKARRAPQWSKR